MNDTSTIPGYTYGTSATAHSPVTPAEFARMKKSVLFGDEDVRDLRLSHDILKDQIDAVLDVWYGFVGSNPHLVASFGGTSDGQQLGDYLAAVRKRFASGSSIRRVPSTTKRGSIISLRSVCAATARRKTAPTVWQRPSTYLFATYSC